MTTTLFDIDYPRPFFVRTCQLLTNQIIKSIKVTLPRKSDTGRPFQPLAIYKIKKHSVRKGDFLKKLPGSEKASLASQNWSGHFLNSNSQTHIPNLMMIAMEKLNRNTNTNQQQCKRQKQTNQLEDPCYDILIIQDFPVWWWIHHITLVTPLIQSDLEGRVCDRFWIILP